MNTELSCNRCDKVAQPGKAVGDHCGQFIYPKGHPYEHVFCSGQITEIAARLEVKIVKSSTRLAWYDPASPTYNNWIGQVYVVRPYQDAITPLGEVYVIIKGPHSRYLIAIEDTELVQPTV